MLPHEEAFSIAEARIADEARERTGALDLRGLGLKSLPESLFTLHHLRRLDLGSDYVSRLRGAHNQINAQRDRFAELRKLEMLSVRGSDLQSIASFRDLAALQTLDCGHTQVSDLTPLAGLAALQALDCSHTQVADLTPLAGLTALQTLDCSSTQVVDLTLLAGLSALQTLDCGHTQVSDLTPLSGLAALQALDCSETPVVDLTPLSGLAVLQTLSCSRTQVSDLRPLAGLAALQMLDCSKTQVSDLRPLSGLAALQTLYCGSTPVSDLTPLAGLAALQTLYCSHTPVSDLTPLSGLTTLQGLNCDYTQVSDLRPLSGLAALQTLNCSRTQVVDLTPLSGLSALQNLVCSGTEVSDLTPLSGLTALQTLYCGSTPVSDLRPLAGLSALQMLLCMGTQVVDLTPLSGLSALQTLDCSRTQVSDLTPLSGHAALQKLDCSLTSVSDLTPLSGLPALQKLDCIYCHINLLPSAIPNLIELRLYESTVLGVPREVLSQSFLENCLPALQAHFADLAVEPVDVNNVKLLLLGNGGVGKTQIARWLSGASFDPNWNSTHGIQIIPEASQDSIAAKLHLQIWDFGGQDIYHGTHALFLHNPAIVMAVWAEAKENADIYELGGIPFRNHPLAYWIDVIRQQAAPKSPVLITQNQCDRWEQERRSLPVGEQALKTLPIWQPLWVSAKEKRGAGALEEALRNAITWLRDPKRLGSPQIGAVRLRVQRRLEALRNADSERPPQQRQHRLLDRDAFDAICAEEGGVASTELLLDYLNANGTVIYRSGLFNGQIVLDQAWALDAIYAVFERKRVYKELCRLGGRFTRALLELLVWQDKTEDEQKLLLGMMQSCGMCFIYRNHGAEDEEYIAPDLLPEKAAVTDDIAQWWLDDLPAETASFWYMPFHAGLIRAVIVAIGEKAWNRALYWRGGLYAYDARTQSRMLVETEMTGQWQGGIRLRTQGGQSDVLLQWLIDTVERQNEQLGIKPIAFEPSSPVRDAAPQMQPDFQHDRRTTREWYVSYAWGDTKTAEGRQRAKAVDDACKAAVTRGWIIRRDKDEMSLGDDIKQFMDRIGAADRILVIMSEKYLMSINCVYELTEIWRNCRRDPDTFLKRVRLFALPDAKFWEPEDRTRLARHWFERHQKLQDSGRVGDHFVIGTRDMQKMIEMKRFAMDLPDILDALANRVQPRTFAEVVRYAFEEDKTPH